MLHVAGNGHASKKLVACLFVSSVLIAPAISEQACFSHAVNKLYALLQPLQSIFSSTCWEVKSGLPGKLVNTLQHHCSKYLFFVSL